MEIMDSSETFLHWDRSLSELCDNDNALYSTHFPELLEDLSNEALLGQLLSDPFLSERSEIMDEDEELSLSCSPHPHIQAEHSYSLSGEPQLQPLISHLSTKTTTEPAKESDIENWPIELDEKHLKITAEPLMCDSPVLLPTLTLSVTDEQVTTTDLSPTAQMETDDSLSPQIKLEPHEVDQFLNLSPKGTDALQMPPTPPSSHGSDTEGSQSPVHAFAPASPMQSSPALKMTSRTPAALPNSLSNSPLLTAPHKLQGSGPLMLTEEERRTLIAEGYPVPIKLPLTKSEEKALKKIRRKIKNKISAQESRRKKKEYMDALEKKVETCFNENSELRRKVENLEGTNKSLIQQLHSLQVMVAGKVPHSCKIATTQTSTCLMVVVLCFAVFLGSFYQGLSPCTSITKTDLPKELTIQDSYTTTVKSRNLLNFGGNGGGEESRPSGLGGEYPEWNIQSNIKASWPQEQQQEQHRYKESESQPSESHSPAVQNNGTNTQKSLTDQQAHRSVKPQSHESPKVIKLEGTLNRLL